MFLPELSIRRPVLATVMSLVIVLLGLISFLRLSVREYPKIDTPVASVRTVDAAANDVRDRVARVRGLLPDEVDEPVVSKIEADAQAIIWLAFTSDRHDALFITDYADRYVADSLKALPGVASGLLGG